MRFLLHPARAVAFGFLVAILAGTLLLMLPVSHAAAESGSLLVSFFTAVSAVCVTGLVIVDTGTYWSMFGQMVILFLCQIGGFGMMTAATLLGLMVNRSLRLRTKLVTQVETHSLGLGDIGSVAKLVFVVTVVVEVITAVFLTTRFYSAYPMSFADAAWNGVFHAISAFNNAGFSIYPDSLMRFAVDPLILLPIMVAIMVSGVYVGFGSHSRV
jgi:trk system potassium uptake protein TrkH|tara:strand:+ start:3186 stop:3824 length:639 start_codon:yes stop_codon:yes gene_type:complete